MLVQLLCLVRFFFSEPVKMEEQCKQRFLKGPCYLFVVPFELKLHIDEVHIH